MMISTFLLPVPVPPKIWIQYQLVGAYDGQHITLQCNSEAFPISINYWTRNNGEIISQSMWRYALPFSWNIFIQRILRINGMNNYFSRTFICTWYIHCAQSTSESREWKKQFLFVYDKVEHSVDLLFNRLCIYPSHNAINHVKAINSRRLCNLSE